MVAENMKKRIILVLALVLLLTGCGKQGLAAPETELPKTAETTAVTEPTEPPATRPDLSNALLSADRAYYYSLTDYSLTGDNRAIILGRTGTETELNLPKEIDGYATCAIGAGAFSGDTALTSVVIPGTIEYVGVSAFEGCTGLTYVDGNQLTAYKDRAFYGCSALKETVMPESVGNYAFAKSGLEAADFSRVKFLGKYACADTLLLEVEFSKSIYSIGDHAFAGCSRLSFADVPWYAREIGEDAFSGCGEDFYFLAERGSAIAKYAEEAGLPVIYQTKFN